MMLPQVAAEAAKEKLRGTLIAVELVPYRSASTPVTARFAGSVRPSVDDVALFKRGKADRSPAGEPELSTILLEGEDMIEQVGRAHRERWGLGSADSWNLDQTTGTIRWTFPDKAVEAPAQILGSHNPAAGSWLWAWANESILPNLRQDAERVRAWAETHGYASLLQRKVEANDEAAATLATIAFRVTEATGFYRAPAGASKLFLTFGPVTITTAEGDSTTFTIAVGE